LEQWSARFANIDEWTSEISFLRVAIIVKSFETLDSFWQLGILILQDEHYIFSDSRNEPLSSLMDLSGSGQKRRESGCLRSQDHS
jgi:hypothetical protein